MFKKLIKSIDYGIITIAIILFGIGITALYSANGGVNGDTTEVTKQLIWFVAGIVCMLLIILIDYDLLRQTLDSYLFCYIIIISCSALYTSNKWCK